MPAITDPMDALVQYQEAFVLGLIPVQPCSANHDLLFAVDYPHDNVRFSYMRAVRQSLSVLVMFVQTGLEEEEPIFHIGYAVAPEFRGCGLAASTVGAALADLSVRLGRAQIPMIRIEAVIGVDNVASQRVALVIFDKTPVSVTDEVSGEPALYYCRAVACGS